MCSFILFHSLSIIYTRKYSCFLSENLQLFLALAEDFCQFYKLPITVVSWPVHHTVSQDLGRAVTEAEVGTQDTGVALYFSDDDPEASGAEIARGASRRVVHLPCRDVRAHGVSTARPPGNGRTLPPPAVHHEGAVAGSAGRVPRGAPGPRFPGRGSLLLPPPLAAALTPTSLRTGSACQRPGGPGTLNPRSHPPPALITRAWLDSVDALTRFPASTQVIRRPLTRPR